MPTRPHVLLLLSALGCGDDTAKVDACLDVADDVATCPSSAEVPIDNLFIAGWCEPEVSEVLGEARRVEVRVDTGFGDIDVRCCYAVEARETSDGCLF